MKPILIVLFFFVVPIICQKTLIQRVEEAGHECDEKCWFREEKITTETIAKWPRNCSEVCGLLMFNQDSTIPVFELIPYFENLKIFKGKLEFSNTKYASIEFLANLNTILCDNLSIDFISNSNLERLNFGKLTNITCETSILDNKRLDANAFCEKYDELTLVTSKGNWKNCAGCMASSFYNYELEKFRNCTVVTTSLRFYYFTISILDPVPDMSEFGKIQNLTFGLDIYDTDLTDLKFLKSLEIIKGQKLFQYKEPDISINNCKNLTRFGIPNLKQLIPRVSNFLINIESVHEDFCFTTSELRFFMDQKVTFGNLEAKICESDTTACIFETMKDLEQNCTEILGNVVIDSADEGYTEKLKNVKNIWGILIIQNTSLTDFSFLESLEYVVILNEYNYTTTPVQIKSNKLLESVKMTNLKRVFSKSLQQIILEDNGNGLLNTTACMDLIENLFETNVIFDGRLCEAIDRIKMNNNQEHIFSAKMFLWTFLVHCLLQSER